MITQSTKKERISSVDALRGFALFGILLANLPYPGFEGGMTGSDKIMQFIFHLLIDKKFITIFSILFGFGFFIQMQRFESKDIRFTRYFIIRMLILFAIGWLHGSILWNGDIIRAYALGGMFLLFVRKWSVKKLLISALVFNILITGMIFIGNAALGWQVYDYDFGLWEEQCTTTSYLRYLVVNATIDPWMNFLNDLPLTLAFTFGNMLIGFIMGKTGFFLLPEKFKKLTNRLIILGCTVGIGSSYIYYLVVTGNIELGIPLLWLPFVIVAGMLLQSLFYISAFLRLYQSLSFQKVLNVFNPVGRTALTNYILQSVFYLVIFFHCTPLFQLYGKINYLQTYLIGIVLFAIQTVISNWWLNRQAQGPLERMWKGIAYKFAV